MSFSRLSDRDQRRFFREVTAAGRLSGHPHVIDVYDAGTLADGRPYLVMELCPAGRRLPASAWEAQVLPPSEAAFDTGTRTYRCIAEELDRQPISSQFIR